MKPEKLALSIGGFMGSSYRVELKDGDLLYTTWTRGYELEGTQTITPSPEAWAEFWRRLDALGFWSWGGEYSPEHPVMDGTSWSSQISRGDRSVEAHGSNAYPPGDSEPEDSEESEEPASPFSEFCEAVSELVGGRNFR